MKPGLLLMCKRKEKGWTQEELGKPIGLSRQTISLYERGILLPKPENMKKIANMLNSTVSDLFF